MVHHAFAVLPCRSIYRISLLHLSTSSLHSINLNDIPMNRTRNIGIIAHIDAGKTTTTERMLFYSGKTKYIGNVDEGDTVTDYLPSERQRGITIQLTAISIPWNNHKINIIDTPGHVDFTFELTRSLRVLDGAVTILDGVAGVEAQTEKVWKQANGLGIPNILYVNKMDRPGAGFSRTVKEVVSKLHTRIVLCTMPYFKTVNGDFQFCGVLDVLQFKLLQWDLEKDSKGREISVYSLNDHEIENINDLNETVTKARESMVETLCEFDENVINSFLENDGDYTKVPSNVLINSIRQQTIKHNLSPVFCGSSFQNIGVQPLLDGIVNFLPSPLEIPKPKIILSANPNSKIKNSLAKPSQITSTIDTSRGLVVNRNPNLTIALAFKVMTHATKGVMVFFRVYSGRLSTNTIMLNTRTGKKLPVRMLLLMHGETSQDVKHIGAGNIGVILGYQDEIITGDTLVSHGHVKKHFTCEESAIKLMPIDIPPALFNSAIEPMTAGDQAYMDQCLKALIREDPSLKVSVDEEMGQTILSGMGELHLDIVKDRLVNDMKAKVRLLDVAVSYKESLINPSPKLTLSESSDGLIKVTIEMESFEGDSTETIFAKEDGLVVLNQDNNIIIIEPNSTPIAMHEAISNRRWKSLHSLKDLYQFIIQGCMAGMQIGGPNLGLPLHSMVLRIKSWDFPYHQDTHGLAELLSTTRKAVSVFVHENAPNFGILEPLMETRVHVDSDTVGEVSHDLTQRCEALITNVEDESTQNIEAITRANELAEKLILPPDYTLVQSQGMDLKNKKTIVAETPLKEMIGYLSRLVSITLGRGTFDMTFLRMARTSRSRHNLIFKSFRCY